LIKFVRQTTDVNRDHYQAVEFGKLLLQFVSIYSGNTKYSVSAVHTTSLCDKTVIEAVQFVCA